MSGIKLSDLPAFQGRDLLLAAQRRGMEVFTGRQLLPADQIILVGLASLLVERGVLPDEVGQ